MNRTKRLLILNYHQVVEAHHARSRFDLPPAVFESQLQRIRAWDLPVISLTDWRQGRGENGLNISFTFDDGNLTDFQNALPLLKKYDCSATFFPVVRDIGKADHLDWQHLRILIEAGMEIGCHGLAHSDLRKVGRNDLGFELKGAKLELEQQLGQRIDAMALPYGRSNDSVIEAVKAAGFHQCLSTKGYRNEVESSFILHRWNMKSTMSIGYFDNILSEDPLIHNFKIGSSYLRSVLGL